jgi:hypothetical protein
MADIVDRRIASEAESVGTGAVSGAAIGAVVAIGFTSASTMILPVVGTIVGAGTRRRCRPFGPPLYRNDRIVIWSSPDEIANLLAPVAFLYRRQYRVNVSPCASGKFVL